MHNFLTDGCALEISIRQQSITLLLHIYVSHNVKTVLLSLVFTLLQGFALVFLYKRRGLQSRTRYF